ncbi:MAG TPA: spermidine/putrescine ABC transporter substrate-binding protein [Anaerolineales bacterium]|nr:spermidine/putrescine ABC transporter substrate-binding protein [Anaerolineales bacterium]
MGSNLWKLVAFSVMASMLLVACGGQPAGGGEAAQKVTASGFACPEPQTPAEVTSKELNLFVWTEYIPTEWKECFELIYGVKVNHDEYSSNEEMYAKLSAGGSTFDLILPTDYIVSLMVSQNMLEKWDMEKLAILGNIDDGFKDLPFDPGNQYTLPYMAGTDAIIYNSDKVTDPPTSWADLWNPDYASRLVLLDDPRVVIGFTLLTLGYDINTRNAQELDEAKAKLTELIPNVKLFDSDSPKTALIAGDVDVGNVWNGEAFTAQQEDPAFQYVFPTEGTILWQDNWAMPAGAPHPDAAYAWVNYIEQGDLFWLMLRDFPYTVPNQAALQYAKENETELYDAYINSPITNTPADVLAKGVFMEDVGEATPLYDQIWTEVKGE